MVIVLSMIDQATGDTALIPALLTHHKHQEGAFSFGTNFNATPLMQ